MGKKIKDHRKKVQARNQTMKTQQKKVNDFKHKFLMDLIEREKAAGKFDNMPVVNDENAIIGASAPILTEIQGPIL